MGHPINLLPQTSRKDAMSRTTKTAQYTADEIALAETLDILIKTCWRGFSVKGTMPVLVWTCIKIYLVEAPYLVAVYNDLFSTSNKRLATSADLQQYVLNHLR